PLGGGTGRARGDGVARDLAERSLQREVGRVECRAIVNEQRAIDVDRGRIDRGRCEAEVARHEALERQRIALDEPQLVEVRELRDPDRDHQAVRSVAWPRSALAAGWTSG